MSGQLNTKVYSPQGGSTLEVASGGSINVQSGGKITSGAEGSGSQAAAIAQTTDNSGGAASDTIAAISDTATKNAIASLTAKLNALQTACKNVGITA